MPEYGAKLAGAAHKRGATAKMLAVAHTAPSFLSFALALPALRVMRAARPAARGLHPGTARKSQRRGAERARTPVRGPGVQAPPGVVAGVSETRTPRGGPRGANIEAYIRETSELLISASQPSRAQFPH